MLGKLLSYETYSFGSFLLVYATLKFMSYYSYKPKGLPKFPVCKHNTIVFHCRNLRMRDAKFFYDNFYSLNIKFE